jgi:hypothetical protein
MQEYCQNPLCENEAVKKVPVSVEKPSDQVRSLCAACEEPYTWGVQHGSMTRDGLKIDPPPKEKGDEPLFRVVYIIDVNAGDVRDAAEYTHRIMSDPDSLRPVLHVIDTKGVCTEVDLSADNANQDDSTNGADYEAAAQYLADQGDQVFTGPMKGGLWNGRRMDACIMSKKQGDKSAVHLADKVAYEFLIKFGDQYASDLSAALQRQWQEIKGHAADLLKGSREGTSESERADHG